MNACLWPSAEIVLDRAIISPTDPKRTVVNIVEMPVTRFLVLVILFAGATAKSEDFTGSWLVVEVVDDPTFPWHKEIKYPKSFAIRWADSALVGSYEDQYGFACDFELVESVNDGHELLLTTCGSTKSADSWSPLHKVKLIDGKLHGIVVTSERRFEWIAEKQN